MSLAENGQAGECLRFWAFPRTCVILGRAGQWQDDLNINEVRHDGVPVLQRFSGGGAVVQGPGCLDYSLILSQEQRPELRDLKKSYAFILKAVASILEELGLETVVRPLSDLALKEGERKISGNAQHRRRRWLLHHGTILLDYDVSLMERYLRMPRKIPEYRKNRPHAEFVANTGLRADAVKAAFQKYFRVHAASQNPTSLEKEHLSRLVSRHGPELCVDKGPQEFSLEETLLTPVVGAV